MVEFVGVIMITILVCSATIVLYRLLSCMKNKHYFDKIYAES
jgi:hypothetical protein